ncbi:hypothetical protein Patl1_24228 [Pistacia atlantica]|uniref:Uncharacterized protein n=1 Tax=Pistacia atlantica TaxID=434234 RepID=A0ACC0ZX24_9ROSI|nr:hypothetical protein Patl1_24228 [Pistacia atlantica]
MKLLVEPILSNTSRTLVVSSNLHPPRSSPEGIPTVAKSRSFQILSRIKRIFTGLISFSSFLPFSPFSSFLPFSPFSSFLLIFNLAYNLFALSATSLSLSNSRPNFLAIFS